MKCTLLHPREYENGQNDEITSFFANIATASRAEINSCHLFIHQYTFRHWLNTRKCHNWWTQLILDNYYNFPISTRRNNVIMTSKRRRFGVVMTLFLASCVRWVEEHGSGKGPPRVVNIWNVCDLIRMTYQLTMLTGDCVCHLDEILHWGLSSGWLKAEFIVCHQV